MNDPRVKPGVPEDEVLEELSRQIGEAWMPLGRRLKFSQGELVGFNNDYTKYSEKAYQMMLRWKQREGHLGATYQVLRDALCDPLVGNTLLAEQFCLVPNSMEKSEQSRENKGSTLLHSAVQSGNVDTIETILCLGFDIDSRGTEGYTPLMIAAFTGQPDAFHFLLERGADPTLKDNNGWSLLHYAAQGDRKVIIEKLLSLELGIDPRDTKGDTPLMVAAFTGQPDAFHYLLERGADPTWKSNRGWCLLHHAAQGGRKVIIEKLLALELDIDSRDKDGLTPLMVAAFKGQPDAFHFLLERGADPTLKSNSGRCLLHYAAQGGRKVIIEKLLSLELDIDSRDNHGLTPLMAAASNGQPDAFHFLLERGSNPTLKDNNGRSPLHCAARGDREVIIEQLLSLGLDIDLRDNYGLTPLMTSAYFGKTVALKYLLSKGARP